jgi:uncharacterized membrane protein YdjX (TVP38/TMEM64 family)
MRRTKMNKRIVIKFIILLLILVLIGFVGIKYGPYIIEKAKEPEVARKYLLSYGYLGFLAYILVQAIHVIVVVVPGDIFNVCGGYIYGLPVGFLLSLTGIMIGTIIVFYISRILGHDFISMIIPEEKITKISVIINSSKGMLGMLVICLIPGIPKDLLMYVAGLTPIRASKAFSVYAISRVPGTLIWVSVGANAYERDYMNIFLTVVMAIIFIVSVVLFVKKTKNKNIKVLN